MIGYKPLTLVDIPGQERLRDNIFNKYVGKTFILFIIKSNSLRIILRVRIIILKADLLRPLAA